MRGVRIQRNSQPSEHFKEKPVSSAVGYWSNVAIPRDIQNPSIACGSNFSAVESDQFAAVDFWDTSGDRNRLGSPQRIVAASVVYACVSFRFGVSDLTPKFVPSKSKLCEGFYWPSSVTALHGDEAPCALMSKRGSPLHLTNNAARFLLEVMDEQITALFQQWLIAFEDTQSRGDEGSAAALARISNSRIAATPAEGMRGVVVKFRLHLFLNEHADAASQLAASAYADLTRLTGHDPAASLTDQSAEFQPLLAWSIWSCLKSKCSIIFIRCASDVACNFRIALARCTFTVTSLKLSSAAICLLSFPPATSVMTCRSRTLSDS